MLGRSAMHDNTCTPRRRWFRFGLRTMFVVLTVFTLWLGWQAKIVRDRKEALTDLESCGGRALAPSVSRVMSSFRIPPWRWLFGDAPVYALLVPEGMDSTRIDKIHAHISEAMVITYDPSRYPPR